METLLQFVLRLAFGLALAMALTPPSLVTSGFYRVHAYVLLGLQVLAALVASTLDGYSVAAPITGAVLSYAASVMWLAEMRRPGIVLLVLVSIASLVGMCWPLMIAADITTAAEAITATVAEPATAASSVLAWLAPVSGGLVLGTTIAAMFLGHWYLNSPSMELAPLRRLLKLMTASLLLRLAVSGVGLVLVLGEETAPENMFQWLLVLRWFSGILMPLVLTWMTWKTLDIPNTQSATGILYVAVITTFTGELTAQLLSTRLAYPV